MSLIQATQTIVTTTAAASGAGVAEWLAAGSTFGLVVFSVVQLVLAKRHRIADEARIERERKAAEERRARERDAREAAADARISPKALALRRELSTWLGHEHRGDFFDWVKWMMPRLDGIAVPGFQELLAESDASPARREALREALVRLYRVKEVLAESQGASPGHEQMRIWLSYNESFPNVDPDLWTCMELLTTAMDPELTKTEARLLYEEAP